MKCSNSKYILSIAFSSIVFIILLIAVCTIAEVPEEKKITFFGCAGAIIFICTVNLLTMKIKEIEVENNVFYITTKPLYGYLPVLNTCEVVPFIIIKKIECNEKWRYIYLVFSVYRKNKKYEYAKYSLLYGMASENISKIKKIYSLSGNLQKNVIK